MKHSKVLVIDDDKDLCMLIERELKQENYEVTVMQDGKAGIDAFKSDEYHLVVLDIMLPLLNGFEVLDLQMISESYTRDIC